MSKPVDIQGYPRINGVGDGAISRINGVRFTHKWCGAPYYLYVPVIKTCISPSPSVENPDGFTHIGLAQQQEI